MHLSDKYPFLTNYFTKALSSSERAMPQTLLFYGNDINAQYALATEIARLLNCKNDKSDDCDCLNCKWINEGTHPAIMTISRLDNKPESDKSKNVISVAQAAMIKEKLVSTSEFHRVFIFCGRDNDGNISGLSKFNFQDTAANALLKEIEEPPAGTTFIFLTRYIDDVLPTIISRSQCFFVPSFKEINYDYSCIDGVFTDYFEFERKNVFDYSKKLQDLLKEYSMKQILDGMQNYILCLLKENPNMTELITHIKHIEDARIQSDLGMKPVNIFDDICLKLIK